MISTLNPYWNGLPREAAKSNFFGSLRLTRSWVHSFFHALTFSFVFDQFDIILMGKFDHTPHIYNPMPLTTQVTY